MGLLKIIRAVVLVAIMLIAMAFAFLNNEQVVDVKLHWGEFVDAPMAWVVFVAFLLGAVIGFALALTKLIELQGRLHDLKRSQSRVSAELTALRNLPLEEPGEGGIGEETST
jgi:uncharacterized integral membrane protein